MRKVNELVKRARMARVHALIIGHLKNQMPFFGQASKQKALLENLADEFFAVMKKHRLPQGDFPNLARFKEVASTYDFGKFRKLEERLTEAADNALSQGIPALLRQLGQEQDARTAIEKEMHASFMDSGLANPTSVQYTGNEGRMVAHPAGEVVSAKESSGGYGGSDGSGAASGGGGGGGAAAGNPFGGGSGGGAPSAAYASWAAYVSKTDSDAVFRLLPGGQEGLVSGVGARDVLLESGLDTGVLRAIWDLSDIDRDGFLDKDEFAVAMYLITQAKHGKPIPATLPPNVVPPTKRG